MKCECWSCKKEFEKEDMVDVVVNTNNLRYLWMVDGCCDHLMYLCQKCARVLEVMMNDRV